MEVSSSTAFDLLTTFYVEQVLNWDGIYWDDRYDPYDYSAPRAVIFNSKLNSFQIEEILDDRELNCDY